MKICKKCGKEFDDSMIYCPYCAKKLVVLSSDDSAQDDKEAPKKRKAHRCKKWLWFAIPIAIIALLIGGYLIYDKIESDKRKEREEKERREKIEYQQYQERKILAFAKYSRIWEFGEHGLKNMAMVEETVPLQNGKKHRYYGFINDQYREEIPCVYDRIEPFVNYNNKTVVKIGDNYALMDRHGDINQLPYTEIGEFSEEGYARAERSYNQIWFIDREGNEVSPMYTAAHDPSKGSDWRCYGDKCLLEVSQKDKSGYVNKNMKEVIPCKYHFSFHNRHYFEQVGLIYAEQDDKEGCLDWDGNIVIPFEYKIIIATASLNDGLFIVQDMDDLFGVIDSTGNTVIRCIFKNYDTNPPYEWGQQGSAICFLKDGYWYNYNAKGEFVPIS